MKQVLLGAVLLAGAVLALPSWADEALAKSKNCMACHSVDKLAVKIQKGGSGVWGPVPMPANPQVNEADAKKLAAWVMGL